MLTEIAAAIPAAVVVTASSIFIRGMGRNRTNLCDVLIELIRGHFAAAQAREQSAQLLAHLERRHTQVAPDEGTPDEKGSAS